jgi:HSP20 family protein
MTNADKTKTDKSPASAKRAIADRWDRDKVRFVKKTSELKRGLDSDVDDFRQSFDHWRGTRLPLIDVTDKGNQYVLHVELPGFDKDDVDVELNKDVLTLKAEKKAESEDQSKTYLYRERSYTAFSRTIFFPEEVDPLKVEGAMDMGILTLTVLKREPRPEERMTKLKIK